jgi:glycosyltransferase involved in cell wall biosynthesis
MNLIFITHPTFTSSQSMPRYAFLLKDGMRSRGHSTKLWKPTPLFSRIHVSVKIRKWLGYIDQYVLFSIYLFIRIRFIKRNTLFVITDQALGPWVPLISSRPHFVHCHDFLAQLSAFDKIPYNNTGFTGKIYQRIIYHGYRKARHFISVSRKTQADLHFFLKRVPETSEVVHNSLNRKFRPIAKKHAARQLAEWYSIDLNNGYILHIGGNEWYKNRFGVIEIYESWRSISADRLPLILIGTPPSVQLLERKRHSPNHSDIHFLENVDDEVVELAYSGASLLLFPSIAEGFGWPILEAMACECTVITTDAPPMSEVGGDSAVYIRPMPVAPEEVASWAEDAAAVVDQVLNWSAGRRLLQTRKGRQHVQSFNAVDMLDKIERLYQKVLLESKHREGMSSYSL